MVFAIGSFFYETIKSTNRNIRIAFVPKKQNEIENDSLRYKNISKSGNFHFRPEFLFVVLKVSQKNDTESREEHFSIFNNG